MPKVDVQDPVKLEKLSKLEQLMGQPLPSYQSSMQGIRDWNPAQEWNQSVQNALLGAGDIVKNIGHAVTNPIDQLRNLRAPTPEELAMAFNPGHIPNMGLAGSIEQKALSVQPSSSKFTHDKLNQLLSKVKHIDELGPSEFPEHIAEPQSAKVTGYHVTQDITAPIKEGLLTNRSVGDQNVQGYEPEHVGGAYFWSHPQVAKVQRERFYEMDPSFDEHPHEFPVMKFKLNNKEHNFLPDEDSGVDSWRESYKNGSFATKNPINIDNLEAIYTGDVEGTKAQIRSAFPSEVETNSTPTREQSLQAFLAPSKEKGVWYHGTSSDIKEFDPKLAETKPNQAIASFVTQSPEYAEKYALDAPIYMAKEPHKHLTPEQIALSQEKAKQYFRDTYPDMPEHADSMIKSIEEGKPVGEAEDQVIEEYRKHLPSGPNIMPVHVRVENPFDPAVPEHVQALKDFNPNLDPKLTNRIGVTAVLEHPDIQEAIKGSGFDSFYTNEDGYKNLGVFKPEQIKSAIGNEGTFDPTNPVITKKDGGSVTVEDPVLIERRLKLMGLI